MPNYRDGPHSDLGIYVNKVLSAWTEVWEAACWPKPTKSIQFCSDFWPSKNQACSLVERMTKTNEISYFNTATAHKHRLHIAQHESTWLCYWVSEYLFRHKPWFFVEVDGQRDLQKNNWIFMLVCFWNLQQQYQTHLASLSIARGYQGKPFDILSMQ